MKSYCLNKDINVEIEKNTDSFIYDNYIFPNIIDNRDFCLPTQNQGNTPHCVGYTVSAFLEVEYWKRKHIPKQFPADVVYQYGRKYKADTISGTKIEYCLNALKDKNVFSGELHTFTSTYNNNFVEIKSTIHRYGFFMAAFCITNEWYKLTRKNVIKENKNPLKLGGHCVFCCGYNSDGIFIQNSWGYENWGNYGFAIVPWNLIHQQFNYGVYIENLDLNISEMEKIINESTT